MGRRKHLLKIHSQSGGVEPRAPDFQARALPALRLLVSWRPHRVLGCLGQDKQVVINLREFEWQQGGAWPRKFLLSTTTPVEPYLLQCAGRGRSLPRSLWEGLRPHLTVGLGPTLLSASVMLLRCCTIAKRSGSTDRPGKQCEGKHSAEKTGRSTILRNGGGTQLPRKRGSGTRDPPV